ncbi:MAG: DNA replication protein [Alphaproteobacteria bacterium]|nr:MAG: DNA replication protein [Alphaproteobacteria bacterium]
MQATQIPFDLSFRPAMGRDDFLVTDSNAEAVAWIDRWPDWPGHCLLLAGPSGSGKTHLAAVWQAVSGAELITNKDLKKFGIEELTRLSSSSVILEEAEEELDEKALFHLFNLVREKRGSLLLTARTAPSRWNLSLPDLASRLGTVPVAEIATPDDALFAALIVKLFSDRQLAVTPDVIQYMTRRLERSFAAARDFVARLDAEALAKKRKVTVPLLRDIFQKEQE